MACLLIGIHWILYRKIRHTCSFNKPRFNLLGVMSRIINRPGTSSTCQLKGGWSSGAREAVKSPYVCPIWWSQLSNSVRETLFLITPSLLYPWGLGGVVTKPLGVSLSVMRHYFPEQNRKFDKHFLILFHYYLRGQNDEEKDRSREIFHTKPTRSSSYFSIYGPIDRTGRFYPHTRALRIHLVHHTI